MISPTRTPSCLRCLASSFFRLLVTNSVAMADLAELVRYRTGSGSGLARGVLSDELGGGLTGTSRRFLFDAERPNIILLRRLAAPTYALQLFVERFVEFLL